MRQHVAVIVNVHAAAAPTGHPRRDLLEQSVRFFQWAREWCEKTRRTCARFLSSRLRPTRASRSSVSPTTTPSCSRLPPALKLAYVEILAARFSTPGVLEPSWIRLRNYLGGFSTFTAMMSIQATTGR